MVLTVLELRNQNYAVLTETLVVNVLAVWAYPTNYVGT
jgi:hypothetical protein